MRACRIKRGAEGGRELRGVAEVVAVLVGRDDSMKIAWLQVEP